MANCCLYFLNTIENLKCFTCLFVRHLKVHSSLDGNQSSIEFDGDNSCDFGNCCLPFHGLRIVCAVDVLVDVVVVVIVVAAVVIIIIIVVLSSSEFFFRPRKTTTSVEFRR